MNIEKLITEQHSIDPFICNTALAQYIIDNTKNLLKEPPEYLAPWRIQLEGMHKPDIGAIIKTAAKKSEDQKGYVHVVKNLKKILQNNGAITTKYNPLLDAYEEFHQPYIIWSENTIGEMDTRLPKYKFWKRYLEYPEILRHKIRVLIYPGGMIYDAKIHVDRSFLTFHIFETHAGLKLVFDELCDIQQPYAARTDQLLTFLGIKAEITTKGQLKALGHYVKSEHTKTRGCIVGFSSINCGLPELEVEDIGDKRTDILQNNLNSRDASLSGVLL